MEHVAGDVGLCVFLNYEAVGECGEGPTGIVSERYVGVLIVFDIEFGQDLAHAVDGRHRFAVTPTRIYEIAHGYRQDYLPHRQYIS
jgi:hypothetical protein